MRYLSSSYLPIVLLCCVFILSAPSSSDAAELFLSPDSVFVSGGAGGQFDLEVRVDANTTNMRLFVVEFTIDTSKVDTVSVTEGTFWDTTGAITVFNAYIQDSVVRLEGLVLGADEAADGPGLLATVRFVILDTGRVDFNIINSDLRDVSNTPFAHDTAGAVLFVNYPPEAFDLLAPPDGANVSLLVGDSLTFVWGQTQSVYPSDTVEYRLEYSTDPGFNPSVTKVINNLRDTSFAVPGDSLVETTYYWRVTAVGSVFGFERLSTPTAASFNYSLVPVAPDPFDLISPNDSLAVDLTLDSSVTFIWQAAGTSLPNDTMSYFLEINSDPTFSAPPLVSGMSVELTTQTLPVHVLPHGEWEYWQVTATNRLDSSTVSTTSRAIGVYERGDLDQSGAADIGDLTLMIDHLFISFTTPDNDFFRPAADMNCQGEVDVADLTALIDLLFISFNMPSCP